MGGNFTRVRIPLETLPCGWRLSFKALSSHCFKLPGNFNETLVGTGVNKLPDGWVLGNWAVCARNIPNRPMPITPEKVSLFN